MLNLFNKNRGRVGGRDDKGGEGRKEEFENQSIFYLSVCLPVHILVAASSTALSQVLPAPGKLTRPTDALRCPSINLHGRLVIVLFLFCSSHLNMIYIFKTQINQSVL